MSLNIWQRGKTTFPSATEAAQRSASIQESLSFCASVIGIFLAEQCVLVGGQNARLDVFAELAGDGVVHVAEGFALEERVVRVAHEEPVFAVNHAEPTQEELVVEDDGGDGLHGAHLRAFLEREYLHVRHGQAVEGGGVVAHFSSSHDVPLWVDG